LRADFFAGFLAADFFAVFLVAAFGIYHVPLNHLLSAQICAMQMRERKYIRFDFTQALHRRATRAERRDYRIIARTRASDPSSTERSPAPFTVLRRRTRFARDAPTHQPTQAPSIPDLPIYCPNLRDSCLLVRRQFIALPDPALRAQDSTSIKRIRRDERIKSKRRACSSQSNFSWELTSDFVTEALRSSASPRESQRESHDSLRVIRLKR
jgi:hypothetical protein